MISVRVGEEDFSVASEYAALQQQCPQAGAIAMFCGLVRDFGDTSGVESLYLEHYPAMTQKALHQIAEQACDRWPLLETHIIHRVGELRPSDQIVFVGVSSSHRGDAFAACEFIMDYLKTRAPFWKREQTRHGSHWVEARDSDDEAAERWGP